jgi:hypothetical protein
VTMSFYYCMFHLYFCLVLVEGISLLPPFNSASFIDDDTFAMRVDSEVEYLGVC